MRNKCIICRHPKSEAILQMYFISDSLRQTAAIFGVNFKTLHRHIQNCLTGIGSIKRERGFFEALERESRKLTDELNAKYNAPRLDMRRPRPKPLGLKEVRCNWGRKSWKQKKDNYGG